MESKIKQKSADDSEKRDMNADKDKRYSIADLFSILRRRLLIVVICVFVCLAGSLLAAKYLVDKEYTVTAIMYVAKTSTAAPDSYQTPLSDLNYLQKIVISYIEVLKTDIFLDAVAKQSKLANGTGPLQNMVAYNVINDTEYFELQVISGNPGDALAIAESITWLAPRIVSEINEYDTLKVLSPAKAPTGSSGPSLAKYIIFGIATGMFLGLILAMVLSRTDKHVKDKDDLLRRYDVPVIGHIFIPFHRMEPKIDEKSNSRSVIWYKELLTNLFEDPGSGLKTIIFSSPDKNTVKSTNCYNLGIMLAQMTTASVLIIDCDFRRAEPQNEGDLHNSALYRYFKLNMKPGLSQMLSNKNLHAKLINKTDIRNLDIICRGNLPMYPADILGSSAMNELLESLNYKYDYILIDTPALNANPDALTLAKHADGAILVVMLGITAFQDIKLAISRFSMSDLKVAGLILNNGYKW